MGIFVRFGVVPTIAPAEPAPALISEAVLPEPENPFDTLTPHAKGIYVYDIKTDSKLYSFNESESLPLASITKIMTVVTAADVLGTDSRVAVSPESIGVLGGGTLVPGERWRFADLVHITLVGSLNDGAAALSEVAGAQLLGEAGASATAAQRRARFIREMNTKAESLGFSETHFTNETGLDASATAAGAYGSPEDVAHLFAYALARYPELFTSTRKPVITETSLDGREVTVKSTNESIGGITGALMTKTGTTRVAGGNLGLVFDAGIDRPVVAVILGDTPEERFSDMDILIEKARLFFSSRLY